MSAAESARPVSAAEATTLFQPLAHARALLLAVSGGPDSTALLLLAARWRGAHRGGPTLLAATVDHGLRAGSAAEARAVGRLARRLRVSHRTLRWRGKKTSTGLQEAAREARYGLLGAYARTVKADHIVTAHTLDDQAETVLFRMSRGSGITGLCGIRSSTPLPHSFWPAKPRRSAGREQSRPSQQLLLARPLLAIAKARLVATLREAGIGYVEDPLNHDPRFARSRLRDLLPVLAREGLDAGRIALFVRRLQRAEAALEAAVDAAVARLAAAHSWTKTGPLALDAKAFFALPAEIAIRLLGRGLTRTGDEGPVQLAKLESLYELLAAASERSTLRLRRTLAGAMVTLTRERLVIERAPARRGSIARERVPL